MNVVRFICLTYRTKNPLIGKSEVFFYLTYIARQRLFNFVFLTHYIEYPIDYLITYAINYSFTQSQMQYSGGKIVCGQ